MSTELGAAEGMETRELVHFVTQQTRFVLITSTLQQPDQLPSMYELEELNPSISDATVYKHIQKLIDAGIVKEVALDDDDRRQGYPWIVLRAHRRRPRVPRGAQPPRGRRDATTDLRDHL